MNYEIVSLDSFNPLEMTTIKFREKWYGSDDHSRWVFKDEKTNLYYKLWNETYIRKDGVKLGIDCGFYDETTVPAFVGLIYYEDVCRGYIIKECENTFDNISSFYEVIKQKTDQTKVFMYDFSRKHVMKYKNKFSLIDLEGVCPLSSYENIANDVSHASFSFEDYKKFVYEVYRNQ